MPLSEEEQRILHEMEQKLYEHDRSFANRVRGQGRHPKDSATRWSVALLAGGFLLLMLTFRTSLLLGTFGFLVMLLASFLIERNYHQARMPIVVADGHDEGAGAPGGTPSVPGDKVQRHRPIADEMAVIASRLRARLRRQP